MSEEHRVRRVGVFDFTSTALLQINRGTAPAPFRVPGAPHPYEDGAIVPTRTWRQANAEDLIVEDLVDEAVATQRFDPSRDVALVSLPAEVWEPLQSTELTESTDLTHPALLQAQERLEAWLAIPQARSLGLCHRAPGLWGSTVNATNGQRTGLHVDSWEGVSGGPRTARRNRLCANLGADPRWLMLIDVPLDGMEQRLAGVSVPSECLGVEFMMRYPDYPVVRLRIAPGEAYIAPTENIIHDGSTYDQNCIDVTWTLLGHVRPPSAGCRVLRVRAVDFGDGL